MTIADFTLTRQLTYRNGAPASGTRRLYAHLQARRHGRSPARATTRSRRATACTPAAAGTAIRRTTSSCRGARSRARASRRSPATPATRRRCRSWSAASTARRTPPAPPPAAARSANLISGAQRRAQRPDRAGRLRRGLRPAGRRAPQRLRRRSRSTPATTAASAGSRSSTSRGGGAVVGARGLRRRARARARARPAPTALAQGLPEPQQRDRAPDRAGRRPAHAEGPRHRRRRQHHRAGPVRGQRRHAVRPRPAQRQRRDRGRHAHRALHRQAPSATAPSATARACAVIGPAAQLRAASRSAGALLRVLTRDRRSGAHFVQRWATTTKSDGAYTRHGARRRLAARPGRLGARTSATPASRRAPT